MARQVLQTDRLDAIYSGPSQCVFVAMPLNERQASLLGVNQRRVLVVDADIGACESLTRGFTAKCVRAMSASRKSIAAELAAANKLDLIVVDEGLPDGSGLSLIRELRVGRDAGTPFLLVTEHLTISLVIDAMRLGALDVFKKPVEVDALVEVACAKMVQHPIVASAQAHHREFPYATRVAIAQRWARYVIDGCEAEEDLRTLDQWARFVGVSNSTLCESCRLVGIRPHDARDLVRTLRALVHANRLHCAADILLDVRDRRTLKSLIDRAGNAFVDGANDTTRFLLTQRFVAVPNVGISCLIAALDEWRTVVPGF